MVTADGRELERAINQAELRLESVVTREVARLQGALDSHLNDRWPHNPAREAQQHFLDDWQRWRSSMDRWRWMMAGGLALVGIESTVAGIAAFLFALFHH